MGGAQLTSELRQIDAAEEVDEEGDADRDAEGDLEPVQRPSCARTASTRGGTVVAASSMEKTLREGGKTGANVDAAKAVGKLVAERAVEKGVTEVVFDRGRFLYHGRVKALADAAREAGLKF